MLTRNEQENRAARDKMANEKRLSFQGIYFIGLAATTIGIGVIILLNLATPLEYMRGRLPDPNQEWYQKLHHVLNLAFTVVKLPPIAFNHSTFFTSHSRIFQSLEGLPRNRRSVGQGPAGCHKSSFYIDSS